MSGRAMGVNETLLPGKTYRVNLHCRYRADRVEYLEYVRNSGWAEPTAPYQWGATMSVSDAFFDVAPLGGGGFETSFYATIKRAVTAGDFMGYCGAAAREAEPFGGSITENATVVGAIAETLGSAVNLGASTAGSAIQSIARMPMWIALAAGFMVVGYIYYKEKG